MGANPLQLGASSVFCNALEGAQVRRSASWGLPALLWKRARSFTHGLPVKALKLTAITEVWKRGCWQSGVAPGRGTKAGGSAVLPAPPRHRQLSHGVRPGDPAGTAEG